MVKSEENPKFLRGNAFKVLYCTVTIRANNRRYRTTDSISKIKLLFELVLFPPLKSNRFTHLMEGGSLFEFYHSHQSCMILFLLQISDRGLIFVAKTREFNNKFNSVRIPCRLWQGCFLPGQTFPSTSSGSYCGTPPRRAG